ncbi:hypothetical protein ES319_A03G094400v1 [Gossypium barbadense]|uniref:Myb/SANT-like domain-containing protein n=2 Tax=Gossypium TaxID=3633 RepID=A0A5J5WDL7_GOSBA|nr:hypothetical protein ES319_A03G094400v1 [Gossypium barbadense]TYH24605.1 hypothetical protein ES288_A03G104600v1 [Gossypium darwinii]
MNELPNQAIKINGLLKNCIKTLKHNFYECYDLFNCRSGFAWSLDTKMWTAKPDLWKALAESKPDAKKWMITRIANYDILGKNKRRQELKYLKRNLKSIREAIKDVAEAIREGNIIVEKGQLHVYSEQEVFAELVNIGHLFSLLQTLGAEEIPFSFISLEWDGKQG